jgi:hypothetical protein
MARNTRNTRRARKTRKTRKNRGGGDDCELCPKCGRQTFCKCNLAITMDCKDINKVCTYCGFNSNGGYS